MVRAMQTTRTGLLCGLALVGAACGSSPEQQRVAQDEAQVAEIVARGPDEAIAVREGALRIEDPIRRTAAVMEWLERHQGRLDLGAAQSACEVLADPGRSYCMRRAGSPHLHAPTP